MDNLVTFVIATISAVAAGYLLYKIFGIGKNDSSQSKIVNTVNNFVGSASSRLEEVSGISESAKVQFYKDTSRILFIDDSSMRNKIQNLSRAGWKNVKHIEDVDNIDSTEIREAQVIFVDYKGIGEPEKDQGLGILGAIKQRYASQKWLILFTAYDVPVTAFEKGANDYLAKNSSKYEVEQKIVKGLRSLGL